jgi:hypothetical protein
MCDSLPILRKTASDRDLSNVILSKALIAASAKLIDNLVDGWYDLEQTESCLNRLRSIILNNRMIDPDSKASILGRAEATAMHLFRIGHEIIRLNFGRYPYFGKYLQEVLSLIDMHTELSMIRSNSGSHHGSHLLNLSLERGVGRMFMAIDLCCLQSVVPELLPEYELSLHYLRTGNDLVWRTLQLNDDIGDLPTDLRQGSANAAVEMAILRRQVSDHQISLDLRGATQTLSSAFCPRLIWASCLAFLKGTKVLRKAEEGLEGKVNVSDLIHGYKLLWLFTIRKASTLRARVALAKVLFPILLEQPLARKVPSEVSELLSLILPGCDRLERFLES